MLSIRWVKDKSGCLVATWVTRNHDSTVIPLGAPAISIASAGPGFHAAVNFSLLKAA
jgi:hypothetical protein